MVHRDGEAGGGISPDPSQNPGAGPQAAAGGYKIAIRRTGPAVEITLTSFSEYASIELYDNLVRSLERGSLRLELKPSRP